MSNYQFKVGDKGLTRDGRKYEVKIVEKKAQDPIVALITEDHGVTYFRVYKRNGRYSVANHDADLVPPTVTVYLNFYPNAFRAGAYVNTVHDTVQNAQQAAMAHEYSQAPVAVAVPVTFAPEN